MEKARGKVVVEDHQERKTRELSAAIESLNASAQQSQKSGTFRGSFGFNHPRGFGQGVEVQQVIDKNRPKVKGKYQRKLKAIITSSSYKPRKPKTKADKDAVAAAVAKRERRCARNLARAQGFSAK